jgi:NTP pyrophosphatase (non-canonical NTP hydrolase)
VTASACQCCGKLTPYILTFRRDGVPDSAYCCGSFRCEVKVRDGIDVPPSGKTATTWRQCVDRIRVLDRTLARALNQLRKVPEEASLVAELETTAQADWGRHITETQESISSWADETFGPARSNIRIATRANEEMSELLKKLAADDTDPEAPVEAADVVIVLLRLAERMRSDLLDEVDKKMAINRTREWVRDGTGCGYSVKKGSEQHG